MGIFIHHKQNPPQIKNPKEFLDLLKEGKGSDKSKKLTKKTVFVKKNAKVTKFKVRKGRYLFTFKAVKPTVIQAIESGLGKHVEKVEIKMRLVQAKKAKK